MSKQKLLEKKLAFLFFAADFYTDVADWTPFEVGCYIRLLCKQWIDGFINSDPIRLANGVANGDYVGFEKAWVIIQTKFTEVEPGKMINERLEYERGRVSNWYDNQVEAGKKGAEKRWGANRVPIGEPNGEGTGEPNGNPNGDPYREKYPKTKTKNITNNIKGDFDSGPDSDKKNNLTAAPGAKFFTMREIYLQRGNSGPLRLHLYLDDTYTSKEIEALLAQNLESLVMQDDIWKKPNELQALVFETYFMEKVAAGQDTSAGKLRKDFIFWFRNNFRHIEKKYNNSLKDIEWFNSEVVKANGVCKDDEQRKQFIEYYLTPLPSGQLYYQTLHNFSVKESLSRWAKKDFKSYTKLKASLPAGTVIIPGADSSIEELNNHYKLE